MVRGGSIFDRMVRRDCSEETTFEQRSECGEDQIIQIFGGRRFENRPLASRGQKNSNITFANLFAGHVVLCMLLKLFEPQ